MDSSKVSEKGLLGMRSPSPIVSSHVSLVRSLNLLLVFLILYRTYRLVSITSKISSPDLEISPLGVRNTTTVFDNPERDRVRLVREAFLFFFISYQYFDSLV